MSKFFIYEERLELQKYLKQSFSFKEISRRLDKNPTTISREIRKYSSEVATGYPGYPYNACKGRFNCRKRMYVVKTVLEKQVSTVSFAHPVMRTVPILLRKFVQHDSEFHMSVMVVKH